MTLLRFTSYLFGGLVEDDNGQFHATNDLIEIKTRRLQVMADLKNNTEASQKPIVSKAGAGTSNNRATVNKIKPEDGWEPLPRRDHSSVFFKGSKYVIIFGGRTNEKVLKNG